MLFVILLFQAFLGATSNGAFHGALNSGVVSALVSYYLPLSVTSWHCLHRKAYHQVGY